MLENFKIGGFDEGKDLDTGELDPTTGERISHDPEKFDFPEKEDVKVERKEIPGAMERGACKYCGGNPCSADCDFR